MMTPLERYELERFGGLTKSLFIEHEFKVVGTPEVVIPADSRRVRLMFTVSAPTTQFPIQSLALFPRDSTAPPQGIWQLDSPGDTLEVDLADGDMLLDAWNATILAEGTIGPFSPRLHIEATRVEVQQA